MKNINEDAATAGEISIVCLGNQAHQVQVNGSTVGNLYTEGTGFRYEPSGMAERYGKRFSKKFRDIDEFMRWW